MGGVGKVEVRCGAGGGDGILSDLVRCEIEI